MTEPPPERPGDQLSAPELEFVRRWRPMIDRVGGDGGQARAAKHLNWTTSTVSRDYKGDTLPTNERLSQLSNALQLPHRELLDLASLLRRARDGRRDRLRTPRTYLPDLPDRPGPPAVTEPPVPSEPTEPSGQHARPRAWFAGRRGLAAVLSVAAVAAVIAVVLVLVLASSPAPAKPAAHGQTARGQTTSSVSGSFPGMTMKPVPIPVRSLTPALAAQFRQGRTAHATMITGFVFRNHAAPGLCLTAPDTGPKAGKNQDPIVVSSCRATPSQVWIPLQWQVDGFSFTHLVSERYQSMCLNADKRGGLRNGQIVQLWDCYPAGNEAWDFGAWHTAVSAGTQSYPLFAKIGQLCLDADKWDLRDGASVRIWTQYPTANQFWS